MVKKLLLLSTLFYFVNTYAETIKTDVLVIGSSASGVSAAIQCARSKVKTILLSQGEWLATGMPAGKTYLIKANLNLPTGIWGEFQNKVIDFYKNTTGYEAPGHVTLKFESALGAGILKRMADTVKNLTIKINTPFTAIKKNGTGWDVSITVNGNTDIINAKVVIDATEKGEVVHKAGATLSRKYEFAGVDGIKLYRTSIATSSVLPMGYIPMRDLILRDADNLLITDQLLQAEEDMQYLPLQMALGQGAGTIAAYTAFFKTTTNKLNVRLIQQELLDFKAYLLPFVDMKRDDRYIRAVQQIGATGILIGEPVSGGLLFKPNAMVTTEEIKPVLTEIYSRAFLWFNKEKPDTQFTVGNLLSLISELTLSDPQTLQTTMRSDWNKKYHFNSAFDFNRPVTRLEFAVLVNQFLNPFARTVDINGEVVN
jgi:ribulose 1,5-bisphosphate synthetase/thiazole synthase